jgi:gliding motility-associated-like protein
MRFLTLLFWAFAQTVLAQTYTMNGTPITDCSGSFFDPGGPSGAYGNNQNFTTTICSDGGGGTHIRLDFSGVALAAGDELCIYDGSTTAAPLLVCASEYPAGSPFVVQATAVNPGGCLTVQFTSDAAGTAAGWSASISCVASCQQIVAELVNTLPAMVPADTGWIDICPGKNVTFFGKGVYPQNGFAYQQSDFTTEFEWSFGDGGIAYGPTVSHTFQEPGGYYVQLFLKDSLGCKNSNLLSQRVRVSPKPSFTLANAFENTICAGDTIQLSAIVSDSAGTNNLVVAGGISGFSIDGTRSDSLALPDGTGIPYETSLVFTEFSPGQTLTNIDDLDGICVNMEHSWMRDIEIQITCPNGTSVILHNHPGPIGAQVFLGIPNDNDNFNPIPGTGFDYCWTPEATNANWIQYANTVLGGSGTLPAGDYQSFQPLTNLLGCPLNGEWTLTVTDLWAIDNGYIFSWGIDFNDQLYPNVEQFEQTFVSWQWQNHPTIFQNFQDSILASPVNAGTASYVFAVTDGFGCVWDTALQVTVLPFTHPDCHRCINTYPELGDTLLCSGESVQLDAGLANGNNQEVGFEAAPGYKIGAANHPHNNPYLSPIQVSSLGYTLLNDPITQIQSVCVDLETDFDADIYLFLRSPDNKILELSTANGGGGDNYKITCFTPSATQPITAGTPPFNGNFRPEGAWSALNNAQVNGEWKLAVSDGFGINKFGKLNWWSIVFNTSNNVTYTWTPSTGLSCTDCPNPVANPTVGTSYTVQAKDGFNCEHRDTVVLQVQAFFPAPTGLQVFDMNAGTMIWQWNAVPGASAYEVNINNAGWNLFNGTSYSVSGLSVGDSVQFQVRAVGGGPNCPPAESAATGVYFDCTLELTLLNSTPTSCFGTQDGAITVNTVGAQGTILYFPSTLPNTPFNTGDLAIFPAGPHFLIAQDQFGCRDTVFFNIIQPPALQVSTNSTLVSCSGGTNGTATAVASGGTGSLQYSWQNITGGPLLSGATIGGLSASTYFLTITDQEGCTISASQIVGANPPFVFTSSQDSVSCFGGNDGKATVQVSGGAGGYTYSWSNGDTGTTAEPLPAGLHSVTVTDQLGCLATTIIQVLQPSKLVIDSLVTIAVRCFGETNGSVRAFLRGGVGPYQYQWTGTNQTTPLIQPLTAGTYFLTATDQNGCTVTGEATVTSPTALTFGIINTTAERCVGACDGTATLGALGGTLPYSINWNTVGVPNDVLTNTTLCPGNYNVQLTDSRNCSDTSTFSIAAANPISLTINGQNPSCPGSNDGQLTAIPSGGTGTFSYSWSNGATINNPSGLDCIPYTVTVSDGNGCTASLSQALICPDAVTISSISATPVLCFGQNNGTATVQATGGTAPYTYLWSDPGAQVSSFATSLSAQIYSVTVTDLNGCTVTGTTEVPTPPLLETSLLTVNVTCFGGNDGSATVNLQGGTPGYAYSWSSGSTTSSTSGLTAGAYLVTVSDQNGCSQVNSLTITQPSAAVTVQATQTLIACNGINTGKALAIASGGNGAPYSYQWSNGAVGAEVQNLPIGTYSVTATDVFACEAIATVTLVQHDSITANIGTIPPLCFNTSNGQAFVNNVQGGAGSGDLNNYIYQWGGQPGAPTGVYWGTIQGNQPFSLVISDQQGCSRTYQLTLPSPPAILPALSVQAVLCHADRNGSVQVTGHTGINPIQSYTWSTGGTDTSLTDLPAGSYSVTLTDDKGCTGSETVLVSEPAPLTVQLNTKELVCAGDTNGNIEAVPTGGTPTYEYLWSNNQVGQTISQLSAGVYNLTLTDANGCSLTDSTELISPPTTQFELSVEPTSCYGTSDGRIEIIWLSGNAPYQFSIGSSSYNGSPVFLAVPAGSFQVRVKDTNGCVTIDTATVGQPVPLNLQIWANQTQVMYGDSIELQVNSSGGVGAITYEWSSDILETFDCLPGTQCANAGLVPQIDNVLYVEGVDQNGCVGTDLIRIKVDKLRDVYVPTGFTPDGNGTNDLLNVFGKSEQIKQILQFRVYDRWGEQVYQDNQFMVNLTNRGWDGQFRGQDCLPGVYVWTLEVEYTDGTINSYYGETTLIR